MTAPSNAAFFDKAYQMPITFWGDVRVPPELRELLSATIPGEVLEFGCGVGRNSRFANQEGWDVTGVDFSAVAIEKAKARVAQDAIKPRFLVGDVTNLDALKGPFDAAFDIGCFHCLNAEAEAGYVAEAHRLLRPGATLLIWAMDGSPSGIAFGPDHVRQAFSGRFDLVKAEASRRRFVRSHWYWLERI